MICDSHVLDPFFASFQLVGLEDGFTCGIFDANFGTPKGASGTRIYVYFNSGAFPFRLCVFEDFHPA